MQRSQSFEEKKSLRQKNLIEFLMFLDVLIDLELLWSSCAAFTFKFYHLKLCIFYLFEKKCKNIQDSSRKCVRKIGEGLI